MGTAEIAKAVISGKRAHGKEPAPVFRKEQISGSDLRAPDPSPRSTATCTWQKEQLSSSSVASNKSKKELPATADDDGRWQTVTVTTTGARSSPASALACRISESKSKSEEVDPVGSFPVEEEDVDVFTAVEDGTMLGRRVFCSAARMVWPQQSMRFPAEPDKISTSMLMVNA